MAYNDGMPSRFPHTIVFDDFTESQLADLFKKLVSDRGWTLDSDRVAGVAGKRLARRCGKKGFGNARDCRTAVESALSRALLRPAFDPEHPCLTIEDIANSKFIRIRPIIVQVLEQFDTQIGWESVKKAIGAIITAMEANYDREMCGKMPLDIPLNCLMLGNPGTGKTTCAHLYGSLLKATGFLSNGTVVSKTASDFIADVVGGSQVKTKAILTASAGKVLLIDEAYVLENNAFGAEVLNTLVEKIEMGSGQDLVVVMCGYEKQMRAMIRNQNPGLSSRFSQEFMFDDYNDAQVFHSACAHDSVCVN